MLLIIVFHCSLVLYLVICSPCHCPWKNLFWTTEPFYFWLTALPVSFPLAILLPPLIPFFPLFHTPSPQYVTQNFQGWAKPRNSKKQLLKYKWNQCSLQHLWLAAKCGPHSKPLPLQKIFLSSVALHLKCNVGLAYISNFLPIQ